MTPSNREGERGEKEKAPKKLKSIAKTSTTVSQPLNLHDDGPSLFLNSNLCFKLLRYIPFLIAQKILDVVDPKTLGFDIVADLGWVDFSHLLCSEFLFSLSCLF